MKNSTTSPEASVATIGGIRKARISSALAPPMAIPPASPAAIPPTSPLSVPTIWPVER